MLKRSLLFFSLAFTPIVTFSQQTLVYADPNATYGKAVVLYDQHKYSAAADLFQQVSNSIKDAQSTLKVQADYYAANCSMYLDHEDAVEQMTGFIHKHPQSPEVHRIYFLLGNYEFEKRRYKKAQIWYAKTEVDYLEPAEVPEYYYKMGFSCFSRNQQDSAKKYFAEVTDTTSSYYPGATYYYGYIAYTHKNYQTAINSFLKLRNNADFGKSVPYYIAECYYLEGNYSKAIEYCVPLLDSSANTASLVNSGEIQKITAES